MTLTVQLLHLSKVTGGWHCTVSCSWCVHCSSIEETLISSGTSLLEAIVCACALWGFLIVTPHWYNFF